MKEILYKELTNDILKCKDCDLGDELLEGHDPHVVGQGNLNAKIMFIAEAPGKQETIYKQPLTPPGLSGKIYEKVLMELELHRKEVFTANTVSCRPPKNRDPESWEINKCKKHLKKQIDIVSPKLIITFGRFAAISFLNNFKISKDHGNVLYSETYKINIFPLYHPSYIGAYAPQEKREEFRQDIIKLKNIIREL